MTSSRSLALRSLVALVSLFVVLGCSGAEELPPQLETTGLGGAGQLPSVEQGPCDEGEERACTNTYEQLNGVVSCAVGMQECVDGEWSDCHPPREAELSSGLKPAGGRRVLASRTPLSLATLTPVSSSYVTTNTECDDVCDLGCRKFAGEEISLATSPASCTVPACAHDTCSAGVALDPACDTCAADVCSTPGYGSCCDPAGSWTEACAALSRRLCSPNPSASAPPLDDRCDYGLLGSGALAIYGGSVLGAPVGGGTGANVVYYDGGVRPVLDHGVYSQGSLSGWQADVTGPAMTVGAASCTDVAPATCQGGVTVPTASVPTKSFTCDLTPLTISTDTTLPPGDHGAVVVDPFVTLTFEPGPHTMASLSLQPDARLQLPPTGEVHLDVCGDVTFSSRTRVVGAATPQDALRFQVDSNGSLAVGGEAVLYGMFSFPSGSATLDAGSLSQETMVYGVVHVATGTMYARSVIDASGIAGANCRGLVLDEPPACSAPSAPTCGAAAPSAETVSYIYQPVCEDHQSALWGLLTWESDLPDDAQIGFSARVADAESELSSASLVEIARARNDATNPTVDCTPFSAVPGCPVDVTNQLGLGTQSHPQVLELQVTLEPDATSSPVLEDFTLTYSCRDDQ